MRSVSGAFNRIILAASGLFIVVVSSWLLASGLGAGRSWSEVAPYLASAQNPVYQFFSPLLHSGWFLPVAVAVAALVAIAGLFLLLMQVPRKALTTPLRFNDSEGTLLASLSPDVLSQVLSERVEEVPGVERCTGGVPGSLSSLWIQADVALAQNCEVEWSINELRNRINDDIAMSLGAAPKQIDVLMRLERPSSRRVSQTVAQ